MRRIWETICSYVWWTHKRGGFHYDVMVTIILLFIFLAPRWINFKDKPAQRSPHQTEVVVAPEGDNFVYSIDAAVVNGDTDLEVREALVRVIEPIAGEIRLLRYEPIRDAKGTVKSYKAWVEKPYQ
ncbi:MAG: hypothetical protein ABSD20_03925 [Terriglobales bacterium]|jgi:hypothetical protein